MIPLPFLSAFEADLGTALLVSGALALSLLLWWRLARRVVALEKRLTGAALSVGRDHADPFDRRGLRRSLEELLRLSEQLISDSRTSSPARPGATERERTSP